MAIGPRSQSESYLKVVEKMGNGRFTIDRSTCNSDPRDSAITNKIMRALGRKVANIAELGSWQFEIEDQKSSDESPHYALSLTSEIGVVPIFRSEINVAYSGYEHWNSEPVEGSVRIVFAGASEALDLCIVLEMLCVYIDVCDEFIPDSTYIYDLDSLKADPLSNYLIDYIFPTT